MFFLFLVQSNTLNWFYSGMVAFSLAASINYFLSIHFVFESGVRYKNKLSEFLVSIVRLIINQLTLYVCIVQISLILPLSKVIASGSAFFWNFFIRKK